MFLRQLPISTEELRHAALTRGAFGSPEFGVLTVTPGEQRGPETDAELWPAKLAEEYRQHDLQVLTSGKLLHVNEEETHRPDGSISVWRSYKFPRADENGRQLLGGISVEVTAELQCEAELRRYQAELEDANVRLSELASVDALTGLSNRRAFDERLRTSFRRARTASGPLCLLLLDVDHFKRHNDLYGHQHGDAVLRTLAKLLRQQLRADDAPVRYGGEEFAMVLQDTTENDALALAECLVQAVRLAHWPTAPVTISAGLSTLTPATKDSARLVTLADEALCAAKLAGRDRVVSYPQVYQQALASARESAIQDERMS